MVNIRCWKIYFSFTFKAKTKEQTNPLKILKKLQQHQQQYLNRIKTISWRFYFFFSIDTKQYTRKILVKMKNDFTKTWLAHWLYTILSHPHNLSRTNPSSKPASTITRLFEAKEDVALIKTKTKQKTKKICWKKKKKKKFFFRKFPSYFKFKTYNNNNSNYCKNAPRKNRDWQKYINTNKRIHFFGSF